MSKTRRQRFVWTAERRTAKAIKAIRCLGRCSKRNYYEYSKQDVDRIFDALQLELDLAEGLFKDLEPIRFSL